MFVRSGEDISVIPLLKHRCMEAFRVKNSPARRIIVGFVGQRSVYSIRRLFLTSLSCSICSYSPGAEATANGGGPHRPSQSLPEPLGPMDATLPPPPVMEAGEAGPPGKMTATSKLPKGVDGSMMPVKGFAGAPGEEFTHRQF